MPDADVRSLLVGRAPCAATGEVTILARDRADGLLSVDVRSSTGGLLVLSEPYYVERHGWVDGRPSTVERVNLAISGVRVPAGEHRVELRYQPSSFRLGLLLSAMTLVACAVMSRRRRED